MERLTNLQKEFQVRTVQHIMTQGAAPPTKSGASKTNKESPNRRALNRLSKKGESVSESVSQSVSE